MHPDMPSLIPTPPTDPRPPTPPTPPRNTPPNNRNPDTPHIRIGSSTYPAVIINNTAYTLARNLETQLTRLKPTLSCIFKNTILNSIPLKYAPPSFIPLLIPRPDDNDFVTIVKVEDAIHAINLTEQFSRTFNGANVYSSKTGTVTITHKNLTTTTSYFHKHNEHFIPVDVLTQLEIPYNPSLQTYSLRKWDETQFLLQHHLTSLSNYPQPLPNPLLVTSLEILASQIGVYLDIEYI